MKFSAQIKRGRFSIICAIAAFLIIVFISRIHIFGLTSNMAYKIVGVKLTPKIYGKHSGVIFTDVQFINTINNELSNLDRHPNFDGIGLAGQSAGATVLLKNGSEVTVHCVIDCDLALIGVSVMDLRILDLSSFENRSVRISMSSNLLESVCAAFESNGVTVRGVAPQLVPGDNGRGWRFRESSGVKH